MAQILLITHISPPAIDGGSRVIHKIGDYLKKSEHLVAILSSDASSTDNFTHPYSRVQAHQSTSELEFHLPAYTLFHCPLKLFAKLFPTFSVFAKGPIFKFLSFLKFLRFYFNFRPDYIIAGPLPTTTVLYAHFLCFISRVIAHQRTKLIINASFHPTDPEFHNPLLISVLKSTDFLWTLTDFETSYFHKNFGIPMDRMINVGNGIDKSLLTRAPVHQRTKKLSLLYVGSFSAHKGIETLIDAFVLLSNTTESQPSKAPTLTLAGQSTLYSKNIETKIKKLSPKIRSHIKIISSFKSSALADILDQCTILISPSTQESFGIVLLEAMARGIPVIGADIPATSELINNSRAGLIFKTGDSSDLVLKIKIIQRSRSLAHQFSINALSYATSHTWDRIGESLWQKISSS